VWDSLGTFGATENLPSGRAGHFQCAAEHADTGRINHNEWSTTQSIGGGILADGVTFPTYPNTVPNPILAPGTFPAFVGVQVFSKNYANPRIYAVNVAYEQQPCKTCLPMPTSIGVWCAFDPISKIPMVPVLGSPFLRP